MEGEETDDKKNDNQKDGKGEETKVGCEDKINN